MIARSSREVLETEASLAYEEIFAVFFFSYNDVTVQMDFICINGDMPSETSHNLSRIGFESLDSE